MASRNTKQTSAKAAKAASKVLSSPRASSAAKSAAARGCPRRRSGSDSDAAETFGSVNCTFASGSPAHRTANCPVHRRDVGLDADYGVVLDRRAYPILGPDSVLEWWRRGRR